MSIQRFFLTPITILTLLVGLITIISLGGCPVQQQPRTPETQADDATQRQPTENNQRGTRPIPPPVIDDDETGVGDLGTGGGTGGGATGGIFDPDEGTTSQPVSVIVSAPDASDINILPGGDGSVTYEVFGGDPADGVIAIQLFYDVDGVADTGDEIFLESNLAPRGTEAFQALGITPGVYRIGIRANNNKEIVSAYATGRLVIVGVPLLTFNEPATDVRVRPGATVSVQFLIDSLAATMSYSVFTDTDTEVNGNEIEAFTGGGLSGTGTIFLDNFDAGTYFIGVTVSDSVGQQLTQYIGLAAGSARTITVDLAPSVQVLDPISNTVIEPGAQIQVTLVARDPEGAATVTVFRDADGLFNGNEATLAEFELTVPQDTFNVTLDTTGLAPGTYKLGASISDGVAGAFASFAPGSIRINAPATVVITSPLLDRQVRSGELVLLSWNIEDLENNLNEVAVILASDENGDRIPDPGSEIFFPTTFGLGANQIQFDTTFFPPGRYMLGVRVIDDANAITKVYAPGIITVTNDTPNSVFREPSADIAVRPGAEIFMDFDVIDPEGLISPPPNGIRVVLAEADENGQPKDQNGDGVIDDADIIHSETSPFFRLGPNFYLFDTSIVETAGLLDPNGNGRYRLGIRAEDQAGNTGFNFAPGVLTVDSVVPEIVLVSPVLQEPDETLTLDKIDSLTVEIQIRDTSPVTYAVFLDENLDPGEGNEFLMFVGVWTPGEPDPVITFDPIDAFPSGLFFYQMVVFDAVPPAVAFYSPVEGDQEEPDELTKIRIRDRINGTIPVADLDEHPDGAILQGFNFNDQGGSAMARVPDLTGDGIDEFVIVSRFGKPALVNTTGVGFGEAYVIYGNANRLDGAQSLNAVGRGSIPGLALPGIRMPLNTTWTGGMADVAIVSDMDGDDLPEMVFSFPRVESMNLGITDLNFQHPELFPDLTGMGSLEYNALDPLAGWIPNTAQFTRGGIVIVSSHNALLQDERLRNRKFDRVIDLHEVGQLFNNHSRPTLVPYINAIVPKMPPTFCLDCEENIIDPKTGECTAGCGDCGGIPENMAESLIFDWTILWDTVFNNQGPGGFHQPWTTTPANPPLANPSAFPFTIASLDFMYPPPVDPCDTVENRIGCNWTNQFFVWGPCPFVPFPCTSQFCLPAWNVGGGTSVWTGFYGPNSTPFTDPATGQPSTVGARILGQVVDDEFGTAIGSNGTWLYISAPKHSATQSDVPTLPDPGGQRNNSGVVYQYRVDTRAAVGTPTHSQLWIEPGQVYPNPDIELARTDFTMPVPHQYIIESVGSTRGDSGSNANTYNYPGDGCLPPFAAGSGGAQAPAAASCYVAGYVPGTSGYYTDRTPQIVGPAANAKLEFVRGIGDTNDDGLQDFIAGSEHVRDANGNQVGAIYIVYSRDTGLEGDYLLERMSFRPEDPLRQHGILLVGTSTAILARAFDSAGDFNGDGVPDVIVGSEHSFNDQGEAILILGSRTLLSPEDGYTMQTIVDDRRAIRFAGVRPGDLTGATVASAGDIDGDGNDDILIAAPNAVDPANAAGNTNPGPGVIYLIYGSPTAYAAGETIDLSKVGTVDVKGIVFVGRNVGDLLGGGSKTVNGTDPNGGSTISHSRGVTALGDIDGDGRADFAMSAMLADPFGKTDAGEVYIFYGRGDLLGR